MPKRNVTLSDPTALRAVANPTRLKLLGLLRLHGPLTATKAGALIGESSGTCSFHFRQLAKYGLVEPAPGGRGREKPWQASSMFTSWSWDAATPEGVEAGTMLSRVIAQRYVEVMFGWLDQVPTESAPWRRASEFGDTMLYLTADELTRLHRALDQLAEPYLARLTDSSLRPRGSRPVTFMRLAFPLPEVEPPEPVATSR